MPLGHKASTEKWVAAAFGYAIIGSQLRVRLTLKCLRACGFLDLSCCHCVMSSAIQRAVISICAVRLATLARIGQGLYCIPGCRHRVEVAEWLFLPGISLAEHKQPIVATPHVERRERQHIRIYDENLCAVCGALSHWTGTDCMQFVLVMPLVHRLPVLVACKPPVASVRLFQVRGPPRA